MTDFAPKTPSGISYPQVSEAAMDHAMYLGISFNGTQFIYREFRYDRLADAIAYAELDISREGGRGLSSTPEMWLERLVPDADDLTTMRKHGIIFEGRQYRCQDFRYDRLADAVSFAVRKPIDFSL